MLFSDFLVSSILTLVSFFIGAETFSCSFAGNTSFFSVEISFLIIFEALLSGIFTSVVSSFLTEISFFAGVMTSFLSCGLFSSLGLAVFYK